MTPLRLGIVTVSFNQAPFLAEAITSVRTSGEPDRLRYVIVDPGSTDGSREIITRFRDRFSSVVLEPDNGAADGLNKGFARCCDADILGYLNSDDRLAPGAIDWVLRFFETHPDVDVLIGAVQMIDANGRPRRRRLISWGFSCRNLLDRTCTLPQQGTFFRRRVWEKTRGFNTENTTCWDAELLVDLKLSGARFAVVHKVLGDFRLHAGSITGSNRLAERLEKDARRICTRVLQAGIRPTPPPRLWLKQLIFRVHPVRRVLELVAR